MTDKTAGNYLGFYLLSEDRFRYLETVFGLWTLGHHVYRKPKWAHIVLKYLGI